MARRIRRSIRPGDTAARLGGDEFAVLCPGVDNTQQLRRVAERIRTELTRPVALGAGIYDDLSVSIGVVPPTQAPAPSCCCSTPTCSCTKRNEQARISSSIPPTPIPDRRSHTDRPSGGTHVPIGRFRAVSGCGQSAPNATARSVIVSHNGSLRIGAGFCRCPSRRCLRSPEPRACPCLGDLVGVRGIRCPRRCLALIGGMRSQLGEHLA